MKRVSREEFLKLPAGTVFLDYHIMDQGQPAIAVKGETIPGEKPNFLKQTAMTAHYGDTARLLFEPYEDRFENSEITVLDRDDIETYMNLLMGVKQT
jgi:hypothetical protein